MLRRSSISQQRQKVLLILFTLHSTNTMPTTEKMEKLIDNKTELLEIADKKTNEILTRKMNVTWRTIKSYL